MLATPHSAAGPALREVVIGSEGALGVIPDVTVRVRPAPLQRRYEAWMAESFEAGTEIVRDLAQGSGLPTVIRVSDEEETVGSLALSGPRGMAGKAFGGYLTARRRQGGGSGRRLHDRSRRHQGAFCAVTASATALSSITGLR